MEMCKLSLEISAPGGHIGVQIRLDTQVVFDSHNALNKQVIEYTFRDLVDATHVLEIEMMGKLPTDTKIDLQGNILSDKSITVENLAFDEIALGHLVTELATYTHNFNGSQDTIQDQFFGSMGCNGIVKLEFTSPVYLWMLENM
jgi:hypothetical protein